jgi:hypothetical protein
MLNSKLNAALCLLLCALTASASAATNSGTGGALCSFKILVVGVLPTIALLLFLVTPFAFGLGSVIAVLSYLVYRNGNPNGKVEWKNLKSLPASLKVGLFSLVVAILVPVAAVACIVLAVILPILISILVGNGAVSAC